MAELAFPLVSRFRNRQTGKTIVVSLAVPFQANDRDGNVEWSCPYKVSQDGIETSGKISGADWLQALLLAYKGATKPISDSEIEWENEDGIDAYALIPKMVPISWGYDFYQRLYGYIKSEENALNAEIAERRRKAEKSTRVRVEPCSGGECRQHLHPVPIN